jgi:integrase
MKTTTAIKNFFEDREFTESSKTQYDKNLAYLEKVCPDLSSAQPERLRKALKKLNTLWVRDAYWRVWKSFFRWCHLEYDIKDPMERVERTKPPDVEMRFLAKPELARVMAAASSLFDQAIVALGIGCGIRASEFGRIRIQDIDTITIWVHGKGNKHCRVPLYQEVHYILEKLISSLPEKHSNTLLFTGKDGKPISRFVIYRIVRSCMDRAGISGPKRGSHCLRHSLGSNFIADEGDLVSLQRIMRHSNITTTRKYVTLNLETVIRQNNMHSPIKAALQGAQGVLIADDVLKEAEMIVKPK